MDRSMDGLYIIRNLHVVFILSCKSRLLGNQMFCSCDSVPCASLVVFVVVCCFLIWNIQFSDFVILWSGLMISCMYANITLLSVVDLIIISFTLYCCFFFSLLICFVMLFCCISKKSVVGRRCWKKSNNIREKGDLTLL